MVCLYVNYYFVKSIVLDCWAFDSSSGKSNEKQDKDNGNLIAKDLRSMKILYCRKRLKLIGIKRFFRAIVFFNSLKKSNKLFLELFLIRW